MLQHNKPILRQSAQVALIVFTAMLINLYFFGGISIWLMVSAWVTCLAVRGAPITQALVVFLTLLMLMMVSIWVVTLPGASQINLSIAVFLICGLLAYFNQPLSSQHYFIIMLISVVMILTCLLLPAPVTAEAGFVALVTGCMIALFGAYSFSASIGSEFRLGLVPIIQAMNRYSQALAQHLVTPSSELAPARLAVEQALQDRQSGYPEWVYDVGFTPGLRAGMRFYLLNIERMVELLFSLNYLLAEPLTPAHRQAIASPIERITENNTLLWQSIQNWFEEVPSVDTGADFTADITALETVLQSIMPNQLALLDLSPEYSVLAAIQRDYKDLRTLLLQQVAALPASI